MLPDPLIIISAFKYKTERRKEEKEKKRGEKQKARECNIF
jgi:hypothetical protein